jgi:hypothetical protein
MSDNAVRARLRDASTIDDDVSASAPRRQRRTPEFLIGMLLIIGGAACGLFLVQQGDDREVVVGTSRALPRGTIIERSDLVALEVGRLPAGAATAAADAGLLIGRRVLIDLPAGVPLPTHTTSEDPPLSDSQALVPIALERGSIPSGLTRGDVVMVVISFPNSGEDAPLPEMLSEKMEVFDVTIPDDFGDEMRVTVRTTSDIAVDLARAERIQLVKVSAS